MVARVERTDLQEETGQSLIGKVPWAVWPRGLLPCDPHSFLSTLSVFGKLCAFAIGKWQHRCPGLVEWRTMSRTCEVLKSRNLHI